MVMRRVRLRKEYRLKVSLFLFGVFCIIYLTGSSANRKMLVNFFSPSCRSYRQPVFSRKLGDRLVDYYSAAKASGVKECRNNFDIEKKVFERKLFMVRSGRRYVVDRMSFSYPYLTWESRSLLNEISKRFRKKIKENGLKGSRFIITSMTRTTEKMDGLKGKNINLSENSPHLFGNAFDITYARFSIRKLFVTSCDEWYMKEALAEVIWQLRNEKKCWATYERQQGCFHIVSR